MPSVTRSQKDAPSRPPILDALAAAGSAGVTSAPGSASSGATTSTGMNTSSGTTTTQTETTVTSATTAASRNIEPEGDTAQQDEKTPEEGVHGAATTLKPKGVNRRTRSMKTTSSSARRRELEAKEELARLELKQAQAAAKLARVRLELAEYEDEDSVGEDQEDRTAEVQNWIQSSVLEVDNAIPSKQRGQLLPEKPQKKIEENFSTKGATIEIQTLAMALKEAFTTNGGPAAPPKYIHELPYFDGNSSEWLAFKVVYEDTSSMFNGVQNMARLRRALKGNAREAIKSLLYSEASPLEVMQALRRRYGRPDTLVLAELEKVKTLSKISENPRDICIFASQISNSVAAIKGLKKPQYLHSPDMVRHIIEKMPTVLKFRWYDFTAASEEGEFSNLSLVSRFLNIEADKCGAFATSEEKSGFKRTHRQTAFSTLEKERDFKDKDTRQYEKTCPMCEGRHFLVECQKFQKASVQDRWATVKKSRVCFKCLQGTHRKESCRKPSCKECHRWHHHLLHIESKERTSEIKGAETPHEATGTTASVNAISNARAYLKIVPVEVYGSKGSKRILALMDEGSTVSLLDEKVAKEVGVHGRKEELVIKTVGGKLIEKKNSQVVDLKIKGVHQEYKKTMKRVRTIDELKLAPQFLDKKRIQNCQHLKKIVDSLHYERESPQLLIGQDNWELIVSQKIRRGKPGEPVASRTGLGWVLHGSDNGGTKMVHILNTCQQISAPEEEMYHTVKDHLVTKALGVQVRRPTTDPKEQALTILEKTCKRLEDGRSEAGLLGKNKEEQMPESYTSAKNRLFTGKEKTADIVATANILYPSPDPKRFSSWKRLWRTTARVLQFIQLCRAKAKVYVSKEDPTWRRTKDKKGKTGSKQHQPSKNKENYIPLGADLLERAENLLLKRSQERSFRQDFKCLQQGKQLETNSKLKKLDVVIEEGLLRLKGRIDAIQGITREYKRPIVLDSKDKTTQLIIEGFHCRFNHGNHATVMNEIRQRFWVLGLRSAIKAVQHQCQWCKTRKAKPQELPTGNLPAERLMHGNPPFTCTGIDYFGPMTITVGRRHEKRWGALFTCLTTRAVHIELTPSLSTDSMIMVLRRFAARRGMPKIIYTDNGTNFVGANKELQEVKKQEDLTSEAEKIGVQWKFIPPGAPNMGGAWERLVRSIKTALDATLQEKHPREEVLHTLLLEAEHIVNSRPLTHLSESLEEEALTPNHFLLGRSCGAARIGSFEDHELVGRHTWKATQRLADHFWQRWLREYLPTLLPRKTEGRSSTKDLQIGDIVLIVDHTLPRCTWPRGRIQQVYPGPDGRTRIVDVETRGGALRRPSSRVVLLVPGVSPSPGDGAKHEGENVGDETISR